jgi:hypothetical protein
MQQAIDAIIKVSVLPIFKAPCEKSAMIEDWPGELLIFLSKALNLTTEQPKLVQVAMSEGKIYWRVRKGEKVLYDRQKAKGFPSFDFTDQNSFDMTWEQFRQFKDTSKRRGTVKITLERFTNSFEPAKQNQAIAVWHELNEQGIIDDKNRLTDVWRMLSDADVPLETLTHPQLVIDRDTLKEILNKLRGPNTKKPRPIAEQQFIQECSNQYPLQSIAHHQAIWNALRKTAIPRTNNYKIDLRFSEEDVLHPAQITYAEVAQAIFTITNTFEFAEKITEISEEIYRPEHSAKTWQSTGLIKNQLNPSSRTELWQVSVYGDLDHLRDSQAEKALYGSILNYDHIPSSCILDDFINIQTAPIRAEIQNLNIQIKALEEQIKALTSSRLVITSKVKACAEEKQALTEQLITKKDELKTTTTLLGNKDTWFTVAIPEKLHRQGDTYLKSLGAQKAETKPFVSELEAYLGILAKRPEDFGFEDQKCVFLFLAALRHLYRCQVKTPVNSFRVGHAPQAFFQHHKLSEKLDQFFVEEAKKVLPKIS